MIDILISLRGDDLENDLLVYYNCGLDCNNNNYGLLF